MGNYTGLRCKVKIKEKYRDDISILMQYNDDTWNGCNHQIFKDFAKNVGRSNAIPFGGICYMPDQWECETSVNNICGSTDGFDRYFNKENGVWTFQCSLKNYEYEIKYFIVTVLSEIVEEIYHLETLYEQNEVSELYELKNGVRHVAS